MTDAPRLVLASASPRRCELLAHLGIPFTVVPGGFDEEGVSTDGLTPGEWTIILAKGKAQDTAARLSAPAVVVGADTTVVLDAAFLNKPADEADARRMLRQLSGRTHQVFTGVCVLDTRTGVSTTASHMTGVTFQPLTDAQIAAYVATHEPMDKAGAYGIQGQGQSLISHINGDFYNVMGLPLELLRGLLMPFYPDILPAPPPPPLHG